MAIGDPVRNNHLSVGISLLLPLRHTSGIGESRLLGSGNLSGHHCDHASGYPFPPECGGGGDSGRADSDRLAGWTDSDLPLYNDPTVTPPPGFFSGPASMSVFTFSGGNWLSASLNGTPTAFGIIPTSVTVTTNTAGLAPGTYSGNVAVTGSGNTLVIPVTVSVPALLDLTVGDPQSQFGPGSLGSLNLAVQAGAGPPPVQVVPVTIVNCAIPMQCVAVIPNDLSSVVASVQTHSGGNWLDASLSQSQGAVVVSANPAGLGPGVYLGAVTLTASGAASVQFPVVLVVESSSPPALVVSPGSVATYEFPGGSGDASLTGGSNSICVTSGNAPLTFSVQVSTSDGGSWLTTGNTSTTTPACVNYNINGASLAAGNYSGSIVFTSGTQSVIVPVTLTVAEPPGSPLLGAVASAASQTVGTLYPGEVIAIHGLNLEPSSQLH